MRRRLVPLAVAVVAVLGSLLPAPEGRAFPPGSDLVVHAVGYAALAASLGWAERTRDRAKTLRLAAVAVAFGAVLELLQGPVPGRDPAVADLAANVVGAALGAALWDRRRVDADSET